MHCYDCFCYMQPDYGVYYREVEIGHQTVIQPFCQKCHTSRSEQDQQASDGNIVIAVIIAFLSAFFFMSVVWRVIGWMLS